MTDIKNITVHIARADTCPEPSHIIGFRVVHTETGKSVFIDSFVPMSVEDKDEIISQAYEKIKSTVEQFEKECSQSSTSLIGQELDISTGSLLKKN
jgi:hypothetical protein